TPACAGTTFRPAPAPPAPAEHPRVRGDDERRLSAAPAVRGTPPRARGRRRDKLVCHVAQRNTPACAGTTCSGRWWRPLSTEHPRVRGDDVVNWPPDGGVVGTPPRARGRRRGHGPRDGLQRNTPACAG